MQDEWQFFLDEGRFFVPWMQMQLPERLVFEGNCHFAHNIKSSPWIPAGCQWRMAGNAGILVLINSPLKLAGWLVEANLLDDEVHSQLPRQVILDSRLPR